MPRPVHFIAWAPSIQVAPCQHLSTQLTSVRIHSLSHLPPPLLPPHPPPFSFSPTTSISLSLCLFEIGLSLSLSLSLSLRVNHTGWLGVLSTLISLSLSLSLSHTHTHTHTHTHQPSTQQQQSQAPARPARLQNPNKQSHVCLSAAEVTVKDATIKVRGKRT